MAKRNRNKYTAAHNSGVANKKPTNAHQRKISSESNGANELQVEVTTAHLATMCGPFSLPDNSKLAANRYPEGCILDSVYGGGRKTTYTKQCSAQDLCKQKLLMSILYTMDIIDGTGVDSDMPLLLHSSHSLEVCSDLESDTFSTDTELTERAMDAPIKTITLADQKPSDLDDFDQSYIIDSITNLLH